jgi:chromosome segregation ATPase
VATPMSLTDRIEVVEAMVSASSGRQDMLASNLIEVRDMVSRLEDAQRETRAWQQITDKRLDRIGKRVVAISADVTSLNDRYEGLQDEVQGLNAKYAHLDKKVDALDKRVDALDKKVDVLDKKVDVLAGQVGLLTEEVGGLKAGQVELRDMVATLLARSEGVGNPN